MLLVLYNSSDLLSDVDRKLFACSKADGHHMLPLRSSSNSSQMTLRRRGHSYHVPRVNYDLTKRSFIRTVLAADRRSRGKRPGNARNRSAIYRNSKTIC